MPQILIRMCGWLAASYAAAWGVDCAECHGDKTRAQSRSFHARTLQRYAGTGFAGKTLRERGGTVYTYTQNRVAITIGKERQEALIAWSFGAGRQARTLLLRQNGQWIEHRISQYTEAGRLSLTPGVAARPAHTFAAAFGRVLRSGEAEECLRCHSTGPERPGVHCESCHGAGEGHPEKKQMARSRDVAVCAGCHGPPKGAAPNVRYAATGLLASQCYLQSDGRLTCVTCHDPHSGTQPQGKFGGRCLQCHTGQSQSQCKREEGCTTCHMPVSRVGPYLRFTDHRIQRPAGEGSYRR